MRNQHKCDVLIIGAGVIGLSTGIAILETRPNLKVVISEKEKKLASHASGRNSGVLHAGFYYSPNSLKARFCREGNFELRNLAKLYEVPVRNVGKVVVARTDDEIDRLISLYHRGVANGVDVEIREATDLEKFEPLATSYRKFLWSPTTGVTSPQSISEAMLQKFLDLGGRIDFDSKVHLTSTQNEVRDSTNTYQARYFINAAGAQADRISRSLGVGLEYAMLPFMGIYRATEEKKLPLQRLVYPVPHEINPFLGVHFTLTFDHKVKIGPTAIPIFGREQYSVMGGWSAADMVQSFKGVKSLISGQSHDFSSIVKNEWPKFFQSMLVKEALGLVPSANKVKNWQRKPPGIRAQLVHLNTGKLEQDFVLKHSMNSTHILNAVSPGWTSALPFGRFVAESIHL